MIENVRTMFKTFMLGGYYFFWGGYVNCALLHFVDFLTMICLVSFQDDRNEKYLGVNENTFPYEVQTAPIGDGVLPGVIRQLVIE